MNKYKLAYKFYFLNKAISELIEKKHNSRGINIAIEPPDPRSSIKHNIVQGRIDVLLKKREKIRDILNENFPAYYDKWVKLERVKFKMDYKKYFIQMKKYYKRLAKYKKENDKKKEKIVRRKIDKLYLKYMNGEENV